MKKIDGVEPKKILVAEGYVRKRPYFFPQLNFWDVLVATVVLVSLGLGTIASQTYRTAQSNPAETLRAE